MSFQVINGKEVEVLEHSDFIDKDSYRNFGPETNNILFADNAGNIHIKIEEIRKCRIKGIFDNKLHSILGKRKIEDAFGFGMHDTERYGQEVQPDFFKNNIGHGVYQNPKGSQDHRTQATKGTAFAAYTPARQAFQIHSSSKNISPNQEAEIIDWCYKYLASKKA
jgi:hypothetical protein